MLLRLKLDTASAYTDICRALSLSTGILQHDQADIDALAAQYEVMTVAIEAAQDLLHCWEQDDDLASNDDTSEGPPSLVEESGSEGSGEETAPPPRLIRPPTAGIIAAPLSEDDTDALDDLAKAVDR